MLLLPRLSVIGYASDKFFKAIVYFKDFQVEKMFFWSKKLTVCLLVLLFVCAASFDVGSLDSGGESGSGALPSGQTTLT